MGKKSERVQRKWDDDKMETVDLKHHEFEKVPQEEGPELTSESWVTDRAPDDDGKKKKKKKKKKSDAGGEVEEDDEEQGEEVTSTSEVEAYNKREQREKKTV